MTDGNAGPAGMPGQDASIAAEGTADRGCKSKGGNVFSGGARARDSATGRDFFLCVVVHSGGRGAQVDGVAVGKSHLFEGDTKLAASANAPGTFSLENFSAHERAQRNGDAVVRGNGIHGPEVDCIARLCNPRV